MSSVEFVKMLGVCSWNYPFIKGGRVWVFEIFETKGEGSDFSYKKRGFDKVIIFILTNPFRYYLSECVCVRVCVCVCVCVCKCV